MADSSSSDVVRVFAISDIHSDAYENKRWLSGLSDSAFRRDVLLVVGDVSESLSELVSLVTILESAAIVANAHSQRHAHIVAGGTDFQTEEQS